MKKMTKKAVAKKVAKKVDEAFEDVQQLSAELDKAIKSAKRQYDSIHPRTKKQIAAGIAGTVALIVGAIGLAKLAGRKKKGKK